GRGRGGRPQQPGAAPAVAESANELPAVETTPVVVDTDPVANEAANAPYENSAPAAEGSLE
ncbi:MAG: hypothetical protein WBD74_12700, partial [Candidatus Aquilonibacter sp.]